ncbi:GTP-binding protein [Capsaspora owczarzaki ATCC 30864]|uniref:GTP-binding protein n=1 Tax=Capsaspora owczarzaki (strain ATCC 30864) TaxID=595528 RepID=A0A0D2X4T5_CAPO3|nr:GTP-binding protein [Capsaspora owczarzaki ATCC 30864]KJE96619.1 GTP-binding protein [Capsaspora owczarzaki ATCC 30864]|eukprot:XP_004344539.1 GTP-binding protein [Capsaspora owczarzaki ATCC 30864]
MADSSKRSNKWRSSDEDGDEDDHDGQNDNLLRLVDEKHPEASSFAQLLKAVFLPDGYPDSVSADYASYQRWDTLQAFCSSINGSLATLAVLKGVGVGDETATATAAAVSWMLRDGVGMLGRIFFAWQKGPALDANAKRWRLVADIFNDLAMFVELLSPLVGEWFLAFACLGSVLRSIVGVAGGATRAAITQHQARRNNHGDVSAKDGSQETLVNLAALLVSLWLLPALGSDHPTLVWLLFCSFTSLHLFANYRGVRATVFDTFNRERLFIVASDYMQRPSAATTLTPRLTAEQERFLLFREPLTIDLGAQLKSCSAASQELFQHGAQLAHPFILYSENSTTARILLSDAASNSDQICSFAAAYFQLAIDPSRPGPAHTKALRDALRSRNSARIQLESVRLAQTMLESAARAGWDLSRSALMPSEWRWTTSVTPKRG